MAMDMPETVTEPPRMNAILELVRRTAPEAIARLEGAFPEEAEAFRPGLKLGRLASRRRELMLAVAREGVEVATGQVASLLRTVSHRLARVRRWKLWSAILSAVCSAGVISATIAEARIATIAGSGLTLAANVAGLMAQHSDMPLFGQSAGLAGITEAMLGAEAKLTALKLELASLRAMPGSDPTELVKAVNALCAEVRRAQLQCGLG